MYKRIRNILWRILERLSSTGTQGDQSDVSPDSPPEPVALAESLKSLPETLPEQTPAPVDLSRWTVSEHPQSPFEKVGRLYLRGDNLMIVSELDGRGFFMRRDTLETVLDGETGRICLPGGLEAGTAKLSVSGKAVNFRIEPFLYTTPVQSIRLVLEGKGRKAALFVGREQVGG